MAKWDKAVARALEGEPGDPDTALRDEVAYLWSDLDEAESRALNGSWSMECDWLTERIVELSRLVGATPWGRVPVTVLESGLYEGILSAAGITFEPPDMDEVAEVMAKVRGHPRPY